MATDKFYEVTDRTIINNNNNYNNNTNNSYDLCTPEVLQQTSQVGCASGVASLRSSASQTSVGQVTSERVLAAPETKTETIIDKTIPANWDYVKLDLFNNATSADLAKNKNKFKLSMSFKLKGKEGWSNFRALLNSPFRNLKRGLDTDTYDNDHYMAVRDNYAELKKDFPDVRVSKAYEKGQGIKGQTTEELSVILVPLPEGYAVVLFYQDSFWTWKLSTSLTQKQRSKNMIGSIGVRRGSPVKNLKAKDILG